ncbi:MAG: hypothetical protein JOY52_08900 [Hyphomicrobiales bacterium]|jgi:hypothetical protein|nr:hypothetical protein [Acidobacteriaceae bacterium]MBV9907667.1 hypothetical protein [Hyphomicrobiales bacterium]
MKKRPDFKFGDRVAFIRNDQKQGVVSRVFQFGGLWWLALEGEPDWRYAPGYFKRVA